METKEVKLYVPIEKIGLENAPEVYKKDGLNPYIEFIKDQVSGEAPDLSSKKGRDRIASLAAQVSRSKSAIEKPGREYLKHLKSLPKVVETELRGFVNSCDALRDEVRKPLTDWEKADADRIDSHKEKIEQIKHYMEDQFNYMSTDMVNNYIHELEEFEPSGDFEEFEEEAVNAYAKARLFLITAHQKQAETEKQTAELEELRRKEAEREQKERDERIASEAVEAARNAAEVETQRQREADQRKANEEKLAFERREMQLKLDAENSEKRRLESEQKLINDLKAAEDRANQAAENERKIIKDRQAAEKAEAERIAKNRSHRTKVNREILLFLTNAGFSEDQAKLVITMAAKSKAGKLTINY
jgi:hypothetical protein